MNRLDVRASAQGHQEDEDGDIMEALQHILKGKKPTGDKARFNHQGRVHRGERRAPGERGGVGRPVRGPQPQRDMHGEGMRGLQV